MDFAFYADRDILALRVQSFVRSRRLLSLNQKKCKFYFLMASLKYHRFTNAKIILTKNSVIADKLQPADCLATRGFSTNISLLFVFFNPLAYLPACSLSA